ncbi:FixH family protein [Brevibacillus panacihumi]|uniref:FixH family protein n=1 Tax=Brevibacillus panacihumi TaxID=497735 RepID=UPI003CFE05F9
MKNKGNCVFIFMLFTLMVISPAVKADVENGWYITGVSYEKQFTAQSETVFYVGVMEAKTNTGEMGALESAKPVTDAVVTAVFTLEQERKEVTLTHEKNGEYKGVVTLPRSGEWILSMKAVGDHYASEFETPIQVQVEEYNSTSFLILFLFIATLATVYIMVKFAFKMRR